MWCCGVLCCVWYVVCCAMRCVCGGCVWCDVCVGVVSVVSVGGGAWHAENPRVCIQNASVCTFMHTRWRLEPTLGGPLSLSPLVLSSISILSFSSSLLFSSFFSLSVTMTMITRPVGSLCKHGSHVPQCQSACTSPHPLSGEHVRTMQETTVLV